MPKVERPLIVGIGRGSVLLKRLNDLRDAMRITQEEVQAAIDKTRQATPPTPPQG